MHREIKFRALRADGQGWVNGDLVNVFDAETGKRYPNIVISYNHDTFYWVKVRPETVGQFTGLVDSNNKEIYEGDKINSDEDGDELIVVYDQKEARFQLDLYGFNMHIGEGSQEVYDNEISLVDENVFEISCLSSSQVIGNIHESEVQL